MYQPHNFCLKRFFTQERDGPGEICVPEPHGEYEEQGPSQDASPIPEDKPEPDSPWSETADRPTGQAALHEDCVRAQDFRKSSFYGDLAGEES